MKVWKWLLVSSLLCSVVSAAHAQTSPIINPISMSPTAPAVNGVVTFTVQVVGCGNPQAPCNPFSVSWSTTSKGGTLAAPTTSTNAGGLASNTMQLGPAAEAGI